MALSVASVERHGDHDLLSHLPSCSASASTDLIWPHDAGEREALSNVPHSRKRLSLVVVVQIEHFERRHHDMPTTVLVSAVKSLDALYPGSSQGSKSKQLPSLTKRSVITLVDLRMRAAHCTSHELHWK